MPYFSGLLLFILLISAPVAWAGARVIDADTIDLDGVRIRLWGVDAPEGKQSCNRQGVAWLCGQEAARALREFVIRKDVVCYAKDRDRYGRAVSICKVNQIEINSWLVAEGWALDYQQYSKGAYAKEEAEARDARRGLWSGWTYPDLVERLSLCDGHFGLE